MSADTMSSEEIAVGFRRLFPPMKSTTVDDEAR